MTRLEAKAPAYSCGANWIRRTSSIAARCVFGRLHGDREPLQCQGMTTFTHLAPAPSDPPEPFTGRLRLAVAAYLARFKGSSRRHNESDLPGYLAWCTEQPGPAGRPAAAPRVAVHPVDAGDPPVQAFHRLPEVLRRGRVLPDLRP